MIALLDLLKDGRAWSVERLAEALGVPEDEVMRQMEFVEHAGYLRRSGCSGGCESNAAGRSGACTGCSGCGGHCGDTGEAGETGEELPADRMPVFWEVVK